MPKKSKKTKENELEGPQKPWKTGSAIELTKPTKKGLYQVYSLLDKQTCQKVGLMMEIPVFIKDPLVALENPQLGVQEIWLRLENGMGDGPTSSRVAVVDFNADTQTLNEPVMWDEDEFWFISPEKKEWLQKPPSKRIKRLEVYRDFIEKAIRDPHFHQVNVWAVVQRVLEFYEAPQALGRPVPWGFDGNRLIIVPHAGYGENAFYDHDSKSLQFYYCGDLEKPVYTCLSHDVIAHETGHAILDGIRPMYNRLSSVQTAAFHEFIGDLTAILLALHNRDIREAVNKSTQGILSESNLFAELARQFGKEVEGREYLRTALNDYTMQSVQNSLSPHLVSQVLTGAMFDILIRIAARHLEKNAAEPPDSEEAVPNEPSRQVSPAQSLWWAADRFRRVALGPLDLCPPCDIQLLDYARAVLRNDILTNPIDRQGYREIMLDVFHKRGLCTCGYEAGRNLPDNCEFEEAFLWDDSDFVYHDIGSVSRSRTAAYYFLNDNRKPLRIPHHQDVRVVDLYDNNKYGIGNDRLPRELVLEYAWQEEVVLTNDLENNLDFGDWNGKTYNLDCGGALVYDDRGNLLSWSRRPGTEHIPDAREQSILERIKAWKDNPQQADSLKIKKPTKLELAELHDLEIGRQRKKDLLNYLSTMIRRNLVGSALTENRFSEELRPVIATDTDGAVNFEIASHLRMNDFDVEEEGWPVNY